MLVLRISKEAEAFLLEQRFVETFIFLKIIYDDLELLKSISQKS